MATGKKAPVAQRPPDGISNLKAPVSQGESNQLRMTGPGPIKPQVLQPQNLNKRVNDLPIPANFDA